MQYSTYPPVKSSSDFGPSYVGYVQSNTHSLVIGYVLWFFFGLLGVHRFYYGKPITGVIWFCTLGLLGVGWIVDAFLMPLMDNAADSKFAPGRTDYNVGWLLLVLFGVFGVHRFYQGKFITGAVYLLTGGLFLIGFAYDVLTLNEQINERNLRNVTWQPVYAN